MPLSDTQLVLLSAASQHPDGLLPRPDKLAGAALGKMHAALVRAGLAEAVPVRADQPCWQRDEASALLGLAITTAGLTAIGVELPARIVVASAVQPAEAERAEEHSSEAKPTGVAAARAFRAGSKLAQLVAMLSTPEGSGLDALVTALEWQPHTVRAALTRLRQDGLDLAKSKDAGGKTFYRITGPAQVDAAPVTGSTTPDSSETR